MPYHKLMREDHHRDPLKVPEWCIHVGVVGILLLSFNSCDRVEGAVDRDIISLLI